MFDDKKKPIHPKKKGKRSVYFRKKNRAVRDMQRNWL